MISSAGWGHLWRSEEDDLAAGGQLPDYSEMIAGVIRATFCRDLCETNPYDGLSVKKGRRPSCGVMGRGMSRWKMEKYEDRSNGKRCVEFRGER